MTAALLILANIIIYCIQRFWIKNKLGKHLMSIGTILTFIIWGLTYGLSDFATFHIHWLLAVVPLAYLSFFLSMFIVGTKFKKENVFPFSCFGFKGKIRTALRKESLSNLYSSTNEELLYRWLFMNAIIELTDLPWLAVIVTILVFFSVHLRKKNIIVHMIDIFSFSTIITIWFYFTVNPIYSILIHILRNQLVICQKYVSVMAQQRKREKYFRLLKEKSKNEQQN